jgi:hypothetical protein
MALAHSECLLYAPSRHTSRHTMQKTSHMTMIPAEAAASAWVPNRCLLAADASRFGNSPDLTKRCAR